MKIELHEITVREVVEGYRDNSEEGVVGYGGRLNIRPKYQREFVYDDKKRNAVVETIFKNFPLNIMYWVKNDDGTFEVLDGQQRTISFCQYVCGEFSINNRTFDNLTNTEREQILNYKLTIYFCEGNDREKLDWFRIINIAGEKLTEQELRNAVYTGPWLSSAKTYFSKTNCVAYQLGKEYLKGSPIRQEYLETALKWISGNKIESYMSSHQHQPNANELWIYYQNVINWVKVTFPEYRKEMKGLDWGWLYNNFKDVIYDVEEIENEIKSLMLDDDVTDKKGIYYYVLTREEKSLNIRAFTEGQKREAYEKQKGICAKCYNHFDITQMEADHKIPWSKGGKTNADNCQMLCQKCNREKSNI